MTSLTSLDYEIEVHDGFNLGDIGFELSYLVKFVVKIFLNTYFTKIFFVSPPWRMI